MKVAIYQEIKSTSNAEDFEIYNALKRNPEVESVTMLEPKHLRAIITNSQVKFFFKDLELCKENFDYFFVRGGFKSKPTLIELINFCRRNEIKVFDNNFSTIKYLINKRADYIKLALAGIPIPDTYIFSSIEDLENSNLNFPLVMKTTNTGKGLNVLKIASAVEVENILITKEKTLEEFVFQEIIDYEHDLRVLVAGNEVLGCMKRIPKAGDFRANFSLGGTVESFEATEEIKTLAIKAALACHLQISGVDVLVTKSKKLIILETNRTPGLEGISQALGEQISNRVVKFMIDEAK